MATQFEIQCAVMAGAAYFDNRSAINRFPVPDGWNLVDRKPLSESNGSGFEASAFGNQRTIEASSNIVISFSGTDGLWTVDQFANFGLATGWGSEQLNQAVDFYLDILAVNHNATITFTGHSLGGGLAALMGVFFNCKAVAFDQAPFAATAEWSLFRPDVAANLRSYLAGKTSLTGDLAIARDELIADLTGYLILREANGGIPRSDLVSTYRVDGEFLGFFSDTSKIGNIDKINHGDYFGPFDLHSQSLLTAFLQSDATAPTGKALDDVTYKLTDLLAMIFDEKLFARSTATSNTTEENLLERLVKHEATVIDPATGATDAMVTRFTADLWQLAREGGLTLTDQSTIIDQLNMLSKALTAFAMQFYYEDTANAVDKDKQLFTDLAAAGAGSNGIRFDLADVSKDLAVKLVANQPIDLAGKDSNGSYVLKGYRYLKDYIGYSGQFTAEERGLIQAMLPSLRDWTVQAGAGGMTATDTLNRGALLLGGKEADILTGGTAGDLLVANAGSDTLDGGRGNRKSRRWRDGGNASQAINDSAWRKAA